MVLLIGCNAPPPEEDESTGVCANGDVVDVDGSPVETGGPLDQCIVFGVTWRSEAADCVQRATSACLAIAADLGAELPDAEGTAAEELTDACAVAAATIDAAEERAGASLVCQAIARCPADGVACSVSPRGTAGLEGAQAAVERSGGPLLDGCLTKLPTAAKALADCYASLPDDQDAQCFAALGNVTQEAFDLGTACLEGRQPITNVLAAP